MEVAENYLNVEEQFAVDESVSAYTYHEYYPIIGTDLNNVNSEIRLVVQNEDIWTHPHRSMICIQGQITKTDGSEFIAATPTNDDPITLVNNFVPFMFSNVKYHIGDKQIDEVNYPGYSTTMKGLLTYRTNQNSVENFGWIIDRKKGTASDSENARFEERRFYYNRIPDRKGAFGLLIPASHLMGFFDDHQKIIYGTKQVLTLMRIHDNDTIFKSAQKTVAGVVTNIPDGKIIIEQLYWMLPHVQPLDAQKNKMFKAIDRGVRVPIAFRHWSFEMTDVPRSKEFTWRVVTTSATEKPRYIIVALQTDKRNDQETNPATFNSCGLTDVHAYLNSERYSYLDYGVNYKDGHFQKFFQSCIEFRRDYYGKNDLQFNTLEYAAMYPLVVIDCMKQSKRLKTSIVDVQLKMKFADTVPANTKVYALIISDRLMDLQLGKNKVELIY